MYENPEASLTPEEFIPRLETKEFGRAYHYLPEVTSTNALARSMADKGGTAGTLVVAETQTGGRGRLGRNWVSPPGGIWLSLVLRPPLAPSRAPLQTLLAAVALREALLKGAGLACSLKWPNDVLCGGKKVAGILTEMKSAGENLEYLVAGVGVNANFPGNLLPKPLREKAGTLLDLLGRPVDRPGLLADFLGIWEGYYTRALQRGYDQVLEAWRQGSGTLGKKIRIHTTRGPVTGRALDIHAEGGLIVETGPGILETFLAGEVTILEK